MFTFSKPSRTLNHFFVTFEHILLIAKSLFMFNFVNMKMDLKQREGFSKVVLALLDAKNLSQRQVALDLDTSPSNFNQRILAGSMRPGMIMHFNKLLNVDLLRLVNYYEQGETLNSILEHALQPEKKVSVKTDIQPSIEMYEMIATQTKTISELQLQITDLVTKVNTWIDYNMLKSEQQIDAEPNLKSSQEGSQH